MKTKLNLKQVVMIFIILLNVVTVPIPYRIRFDKSTAEDLLKGAYIPLEAFVKAGTPTEDEELLLVPSHIKNEKDFVRLFSNKIDNHVVEGFFEDLVTEKEGDLYIDKRAYIPSIYAENSVLTNSYIRKKKSLYSLIFDDNENDNEEERLVVKEKWKITGEWNRRSNYFVKDENDEWVLEYFNGTRMHRFVEPSHNPWSYY